MGSIPKLPQGPFSPSLHICIKKCLVRDLDKLSTSPIVDIRVQYSSEATLPGYHKVNATVGGLPGNHTGLGARAKYLYVLRADAVVSTNGTQTNRTGSDMNRRVCDVRLVSYEPGMLQSYGVFENPFSQGEEMSKIKNQLQQEGVKINDGW